MRRAVRTFKNRRHATKLGRIPHSSPPTNHIPRPGSQRSICWHDALKPRCDTMRTATSIRVRIIAATACSPAQCAKICLPPHRCCAAAPSAFPSTTRKLWRGRGRKTWFKWTRLTKASCGERDPRYLKSILFSEFVEILETLNARDIRYLVSYDGRTGNKVHGRRFPAHLRLQLVELEVGRSSQATLLGRNEVTYESVYLSRPLAERLQIRLPTVKAPGRTNEFVAGSLMPKPKPPPPGAVKAGAASPSLRLRTCSIVWPDAMEFTAAESARWLGVR